MVATQSRETEAERRRFGIVELLAIIAILGILAVFVAFAVDNSNQAALTSACATDAKNVRAAIDAYRAKHHTTDNPPISGPNSLVSDGDLAAPSKDWKLVYLGHAPLLGAAAGSQCRGTA